MTPYGRCQERFFDFYRKLGNKNSMFFSSICLFVNLILTKQVMIISPIMIKM